MDKVEGYQLRQISDSMSKHFNPKINYDAVKYNFKIKYSVDTFNRDKLRWQYAALERKLSEACNGNPSKAFMVLYALLVAETNSFKNFHPSFMITSRLVERNPLAVDFLSTICIMGVVPEGLKEIFKLIDSEVTSKSLSKFLMTNKSFSDIYIALYLLVYAPVALQRNKSTMLSTTLSKYENLIAIIASVVDAYALTQSL